MHTRTMKVVGRSATAVALGMVLTVGSASLAAASSSHDHGNKNRDCASGKVSSFDYANIGRGGYVTAVTATSVTVQQWSGTTTTYTLSSTTAYTEGKSPSTFASLVVGDRVNVQTSSDPTTATSVNIELAELFGRVTAISGNNVTITDPQGFSRTIVVTSTSTYTSGGAPGSFSDVKVGSTIVAQGTIDTNLTSLDAVSVEVGGAAAASSETVRGVVTAATSSSVTVHDDHGTTTTFTFTTTTAFKVGSSTGSATDLAVGQNVDVKVSTAASTTALSVEIELTHLIGKVTAVNGDTITIAGPQGSSRNIFVSSATTYSHKGAPAMLSDVVVGTRIRAEGTIAADHTTLDAITVTICHDNDPSTAPQSKQKSDQGNQGDHNRQGSGGHGSHGRGHNRH